MQMHDSLQVDESTTIGIPVFSMHRYQLAYNRPNATSLNFFSFSLEKTPWIILLLFLISLYFVVDLGWVEHIAIQLNDGDIWLPSHATRHEEVALCELIKSS
jgi:hypothetical protein